MSGKNMLRTVLEHFDNNLEVINVIALSICGNRKEKKKKKRKRKRRENNTIIDSVSKKEKKRKEKKESE